MTILSVRTDRPEAEIGLYENDKQLAYEMWEAHRQLSSTIHIKIRELLKSQKKSWPSVEGVVFFIGPGSFTGLRIGATMANTIAATLNVPIVGTNGDDWIKAGLTKLKNSKGMQLVIPLYGQEPHITTQKK